MFQGQHDGPSQFLFADQHKVVQVLPQDALRQSKGGASGQSLGKGLHFVFDQLLGLPGFEGRRGRRCLHADDLYRWVEGLDHGAHPRRAAATAHRHDDRLNVWQVFQDFQCIGAHAGDEVRFVARVDVAIALLGGQALHDLAGGVKVGAVKAYLGAQGAHGGYLARVGSLRHADDDAHAKEPPRVGDRLPVVAGAGRDHAPPPLVLAQLRCQVDAASHFEGAHGLVIFVLDTSLKAQ